MCPSLEFFHGQHLQSTAVPYPGSNACPHPQGMEQGHSQALTFVATKYTILSTSASLVLAI